MGDNRDRSRDSRSFGPVSLDSVVGRALLRYWPVEDVGFFQLFRLMWFTYSN